MQSLSELIKLPVLSFDYLPIRYWKLQSEFRSLLIEITYLYLLAISFTSAMSQLKIDVQGKGFVAKL